MTGHRLTHPLVSPALGPYGTALWLWLRSAVRGRGRGCHPPSRSKPCDMTATVTMVFCVRDDDARTHIAVEEEAVFHVFYAIFVISRPSISFTFGIYYPGDRHSPSPSSRTRPPIPRHEDATKMYPTNSIVSPAKSTTCATHRRRHQPQLSTSEWEKTG